VANVGAADAPITLFLAYISEDAVIDNSDALVYNEQISALAVAGSQQISATPSWPDTLDTGDYSLIFVVDKVNDVIEPDESNNIAIIAISATDADVEDPTIIPGDNPEDWQDGDGSQTYSAIVTDNVDISRVDIIYKGILASVDSWNTIELTETSANNFAITLEPTIYNDEVGVMFLFRAFLEHGRESLPVPY